MCQEISVSQVHQGQMENEASAGLQGHWVKRDLRVNLVYQVQWDSKVYQVHQENLAEMVAAGLVNAHYVRLR